ncbi:MAG: histidinol-phosphate transaminase [Bacteroidia bacterium]|nr:histidinol-phosphate transaminase [Bacteroidia bacterium]MDW8346949.1 histidinol-phosphate transaminase [Bacteroidia bacterium]
MNIEDFIRPNIKNLVAYSSARSEFYARNAIFLDANESPYGKYNRYPDPYQVELKKCLSEYKKVPLPQIFIGNGSDEVLDVLMRVFLEPQQDSILIFPPTYGIYEVLANIHHVETHKIPLTQHFDLDITAIEAFLQEKNPKMAIICSPNNPTGNIIERIDQFLQIFKGIVVIDEAYIDFTVQEHSNIRYIDSHPNLVITQTLSKAWGLAGLRIGMAFAHPVAIQYMNKVKYPYNVSSLNQKVAIKALSNPDKVHRRIEKIRKRRAYLSQKLRKFKFVERIFPSEANFVLVQVSDAHKIYERLLSVPIVVRNRHSQVPNTLRITVGTKKEIELLLYQLSQIENEDKG